MEKADFKRFCCVIIFTVSMHLLTMPIFLYGQKMNAVRIAFLLIHNFFAVLVYFFMILVKKKKGYVGFNENTAELLRKEPSMYCIRCDNFKPERAHHCSKCRQCIRKMDHHCMWLGNCVNNDNIGHFIRMLFFSVADLLLLFSFSVYSLIMRDRFETQYFFRVLTVLIVIIALISLLFTLALGYFLFERFLFVLQNITFLESCCLDSLKESGILSACLSPYDLGWKKNLEVQLGKPYFLYMYGEKGDGLSFEKAFFLPQWPPSNILGRRQYNEILLV